jgi:DNA-binding transcriptional LysR family regulator
MIGIRMVIPLLGGFTRAYPELRVIVDLSDVPFPKDDTSCDVFIRLGDVEDDKLNASRIAHSRRVICAAPAYIGRTGEPKRPQDLSGHDCLLLSGLGVEHNEWSFDGPDGRETIRVKGNLVFTSGDGHYEALLAGHGIGRVTELFAGPDLASGRLIRLLEPYQSKKVEPIHALYRGGRHAPLKVRAFLDYLKRCSQSMGVSQQTIEQEKRPAAAC